MLTGAKKGVAATVRSKQPQLRDEGDNALKTALVREAALGRS